MLQGQSLEHPGCFHMKGRRPDELHSALKAHQEDRGILQPCVTAEGRAGDRNLPLASQLCASGISSLPAEAPHPPGST